MSLSTGRVGSSAPPEAVAPRRRAGSGKRSDFDAMLTMLGAPSSAQAPRAPARPAPSRETRTVDADGPRRLDRARDNETHRSEIGDARDAASPGADADGADRATADAPADESAASDARATDAAGATPPTGTDDDPVAASLDPELRARLARVRERMKDEYGHEVTLVEGMRSPERQARLFAQGRTAPGPVVTWTRDSRHLTGDAVDVQVDGSWSNPEAYAHLERIAREEGLHTLGPADAGHLELVGSGEVAGVPGTGADVATLGGTAAGATAGGTTAAAVAAVGRPGVSPVARTARVASTARVAQVARPGTRTQGARESGAPATPSLAPQSDPGPSPLGGDPAGVGPGSTAPDLRKPPRDADPSRDGGPVPFGAPDGPLRTAGAPSRGTEAAPSEPLRAIAPAIDAMDRAAELRPARLSLRFDAQADVGQVDVSVGRSRVDVALAVRDDALARSLRARSDELGRALHEIGREIGTVSVQRTADAPQPRSAGDDPRGAPHDRHAPDRHAPDRRDPADEFSHRRPRSRGREEDDRDL